MIPFDELIDEILAALREITALSADPANQVQAGDGGITMGSPPYVLIGGPSIDTAYGSTADLDGVETTYTFPFWVYATATDDTPYARITAAMVLALEVRAKLHEVHRSDETYPHLHNAPVCLVSIDGAWGDGADLPATCGVASGQIRLTFPEDV